MENLKGIKIVFNTSQDDFQKIFDKYKGQYAEDDSQFYVSQDSVSDMFFDILCEFMRNTEVQKS